MADAITQLVLIAQRRNAQATADARATVERTRQAVDAKRQAMVGPRRLEPSVPQLMSANRLEVRLRAFRASLATDEADLLDDWLTRAVRASQA